MGSKVHRETFKLLQEADQKKSERRKKIRNIVILILVAIIAGGVWYYAYLKVTEYQRKQENLVGALMPVKCTMCGHEEVRRVRDILTAKCNKCRSPIGYAAKCLKCKEIFAFRPEPIETSDKEEYLKLLAEREKCTLCGNDKIKRLTVKEYETLKEKEPSKKKEEK
jgi:hypothetical protein